MAYGPLGLIRPVLLGFLVGNLAFLVVRTAIGQPGQLLERSDELRLYFVCAAGATLIAAIAASIVNFVIGQRLRKAIEVQRLLFSGEQLPPAIPRPDVPGYDLMPKASRAQTAEPPRSKAA